MQNIEVTPPKICFCGRPNVGKSSLFNRLLGKKKALVLDKPGVTRDVYRQFVDWDGVEIEVADLAGLELWEDKHIAKKKAQHPHGNNDEQLLRELSVKAAIDYLETSDLVLYVMDGREGLTPLDEELARLVRTKSKQVLLVLSKIEGKVAEQAQSDAAALGWGEGVETSAEHNQGIYDLKERIVSTLTQMGKLSLEKPLATEEEVLDSVEESTEKTAIVFDAETSEEELDQRALAAAQKVYPPRGLTKDTPIRLGVYGRPNVGKSTLTNQLLGENRMITSPIPGTTVDVVDSDFIHSDRYYRILDTAGIRRKSKTEKGVEVLSVVQALKSVREVDVALFMIDGFEGVTDQDEKVAGELVKTGKPVIIVVNKWDLCRVDKEEYSEKVREALGFLDFAPVLFLSAKQGRGIDVAWDLLDEIMKNRHIIAPTGELNRFLKQVEGRNNPGDVRLYYASQTAKNPPTITILVNRPDKVHYSYERFLKNELRDRYGWMGNPLKLIFKARKRSPSKKA